MSQVISPGTMPAAVGTHLSSRTSAPYATLIRRLAKQGESQTIGLTSCAHNEGVSTVAANLAVAAASEPVGLVLLIDTDCVQSQTESTFGLPPGLGFADAMSSLAKLAECIRPTSVPNLHVMGPGRQAVTSQAIATPATFGVLIDRLKRDYAWVVFDLPIVSECHFPALISSLDGILLVVEAERLRRQVVRRAKNQLEDNGARIAGVVFNKQQDHLPKWLHHRV